MDSKTAGTICRKALITVDRRVKITDAAETMLKHGIGSLVVVSGGDPVGIITKRDIVTRTVARGFTGVEVIVGDILTTPVVKVSPFLSLKEAALEMEKKKTGHLLVVDNGDVIGIVSRMDILRNLKGMF